MAVKSHKINSRMTVQLDRTRHNTTESRNIRILDEDTGLSIMVGDPYYWTKKKAENAFESTSSLLKSMIAGEK